MGLYLSDISGVFDRVGNEYLLRKLQDMGIGQNYIIFLDVYLGPRQAKVIIEGFMSEKFMISNSVFQSIVLRPSL